MNQQISAFGSTKRVRNDPGWYHGPDFDPIEMAMPKALIRKAAERIMPKQCNAVRPQNDRFTSVEPGDGCVDAGYDPTDRKTLQLR